jgi:hypothetical protein
LKVYHLVLVCRKTLIQPSHTNARLTQYDNPTAPLLTSRPGNEGIERSNIFLANEENIFLVVQEQKV